MSRSFTYYLNSLEIEVVIVRDHGYEPDTNAHEVDWHTIPEITLTDQEEDDIMTAIYNFLDSYTGDYDE